MLSTVVAPNPFHQQGTETVSSFNMRLWKGDIAISSYLAGFASATLRIIYSFGWFSEGGSLPFCGWLRRPLGRG